MEIHLREGNTRNALVIKYISVNTLRFDVDNAIVHFMSISVERVRNQNCVEYKTQHQTHISFRGNTTFIQVVVFFLKERYLNKELRQVCPWIYENNPVNKILPRLNFKEIRSDTV
mgnify:CR=1 FL=1